MIFIKESNEIRVSKGSSFCVNYINRRMSPSYRRNYNISYSAQIIGFRIIVNL